jgi:hypothetical protein
MHMLLSVRGSVRVRQDSTNLGSHSLKKGAKEIIVKSGVWVYGDFRERLTRQHHECFSSSLPSDRRVVQNRGVYSSKEVVGHDKYPESLTSRRMMDVSVFHGRTDFRLTTGRQGNSGTSNGSRIFRANHAVIMNEIRCILRVIRQGIDFQRLTEDVRKLQAD